MNKHEANMLIDKILSFDKASDKESVLSACAEFRLALNDGLVTVVEPYQVEDSSEESACHGWRLNVKVKQCIIKLFQLGDSVSYSGFFVDKDTTPPYKGGLKKGTRIVPGGTSCRDGVYIGENVIIMPPSFVNIGAFIDDDTMVDSNVTIGSCARIGKGCHISAGVTVGGVLEPATDFPNIIEDNVFVGAGSALLSGIILKKGVCVSAGVTLVNSIEIVDLVNDRVISAQDGILVVPENAVVVPGSRQKCPGVYVNCPVIVKYRDDSTNAKTALNMALRESCS